MSVNTKDFIFQGSKFVTREQSANFRAMFVREGVYILLIFQTKTNVLVISNANGPKHILVLKSWETFRVSDKTFIASDGLSSTIHQLLFTFIRALSRHLFHSYFI